MSKKEKAGREAYDQFVNDKEMEKKVTNTLGEGKPQEHVKKRVMRIQFDVEYGGSPGIVLDGKSVTVPDMQMTVRQLLENHSRGVDGKETIRQPLYFETEIPTLRDLVDVEEYEQSLQDRLEKVKEFKEAQKVKEAEERQQKQKEESAKRQSDKEKIKDEVVGQTRIPDVE